MGFHAWMKGLNAKDALTSRRNMPDKRREALGDNSIRSNRIPQLFSPYFWECVAIWRRYRTLGLPYAGGWAEQPAHLIRIIELFENCYEQEQAKEIPNGNIRRVKASRQSRSNRRY